MCVVVKGPRLELISVCHMRRYSDSSSVGSSRDRFFFNQLRRGRGPVCCVVSGRRVILMRRFCENRSSEGGSDVSVVSPAPRGARFFFPMVIISAATRMMGARHRCAPVAFVQQGFCAAAAEQAMELGRAYTSTKLWRRQLSRAENELLLGRNTAVAQSLPV